MSLPKKTRSTVHLIQYFLLTVPGTNTVAGTCHCIPSAVSNRTSIMKPVILAVLLLFVVASLVAGAPSEGGKSAHEDEKCLALSLQTLEK
jgi:p-aminobenzoyl-glutamate transporter AbgT